MVVGWALAITPILYILFAHRFGWTLGSVDKAYRLVQINDVVAFAVAILGLNIAIGYSGQLSLGQSAFVGLGAYTSMVMVVDHGWSYFAALPVAATRVLRRRVAHRPAGVTDQGLLPRHRHAWPWPTSSPSWSSASTRSPAARTARARPAARAG